MAGMMTVVFRLLAAEIARLVVLQAADHQFQHAEICRVVLQSLHCLSHERVLRLTLSPHAHLQQLSRTGTLCRVLHQTLAHEVNKLL